MPSSSAATLRLPFACFNARNIRSLSSASLRKAKLTVEVGFVTASSRHNIDMIVVGKHNHGFLSTVFLGSVASSVMRKSPVPVLVVPVTKEED